MDVCVTKHERSMRVARDVTRDTLASSVICEFAICKSNLFIKLNPGPRILL